jgi:hypothetical protein
MARLEARRGDIRLLRSADQVAVVGKPRYGGVLKIVSYTSAKISRSASPIFLIQTGYSSSSPRILPEYSLPISLVHGWNLYLMSVSAASRVPAELSLRRALEAAADSWEATLGHGVRSHSTSYVSLESPPGARREGTHAGGGSQPEERHGLAVEVFNIDRRRKTPVRRVFEQIYSYPTSFSEPRLDPRVFNQPLP